MLCCQLGQCCPELSCVQCTVTAGLHTFVITACVVFLFLQASGVLPGDGAPQNPPGGTPAQPSSAPAAAPEPAVPAQTAADLGPAQMDTDEPTPPQGGPAASDQEGEPMSIGEQVCSKHTHTHARTAMLADMLQDARVECWDSGKRLLESRGAFCSSCLQPWCTFVAHRHIP